MKNRALTQHNVWGCTALFVSSPFLLSIGCGADELAPLAEDPLPALLCDDGSEAVDGDCPALLGSISGRICDFASGTWVAGVEASVVSGNTVLTAVTDAEGRFTIEGVPPGNYFVQLTGVDYTGELVAFVSAGQTTTIGEAECVAPPGNLLGRVCNEELGVWVTGATVTLDDAAATSTVTDANGEFLFTGLAPGDYVLTISATSYSGTRSASVVSAQTTDIGPTDCIGAAGSIEGRICGGNGYWLSGARVFIDLGGGNTNTIETTIETTTGADGTYTLTGVPAGTHNVQVTRGSFNTSFSVTVGAGEAVVLPNPVCIPPTTFLAVVTGIYDSVEGVLTDLGFPLRNTFNSMSPTVTDPNGNIDLIKGDTSAFWLTNFLSDPVWMGDYDVIFINCGVEDSELMIGGPVADAAVQNLKDFVQDGGSVYASDWGGEIIRMAFPGAIDFLGNDGSFGAARVGVADSTLSATAVDAGLVTALGRTALSLNLDLSQWVALEPMSQQPSTLSTLVKGNVQTCVDPFCFFTQSLNDVPLVVRFNYGNGRVLYTSAHNESQTTQDLRDVLNYVVFEL